MKSSRLSGLDLSDSYSLRNLRRVLSDVTCARRNRPVHSDAFVIRSNPLAPAVSLGGFDPRPIVDAKISVRVPSPSGPV